MVYNCITPYNVLQQWYAQMLYIFLDLLGVYIRSLAPAVTSLRRWWTCLGRFLESPGQKRMSWGNPFETEEKTAWHTYGSKPWGLCMCIYKSLCIWLYNQFFYMMICNIYIDINICLYIYIYRLCIWLYNQICIYVYMILCIVYIYTIKCIYIYIWLYIYIYIYIYMIICIYIWLCIYMIICICYYVND